MLGAVIRFIVSALVLMFVQFFVPGFRVLGFINALLAALAIAAIGYVIEALLGDKISPRNRGLVGFLTSAVVIWSVQFFVPTMSVSLIGAVLAALVIGIIDAFVPTELK